MLRPNRAFFAGVVFLIALAAAPASFSATFRNLAYSALKTPVQLSREAAILAGDLWHFRANAQRARKADKGIERAMALELYAREALAENERLTRLLDIKKIIPPGASSLVTARVIGRSPSTWNRVCLIDKGTGDGVRVHMLVLSGLSVAGKVIEAGPSVSKVLLVTDPNCRVGALVQRTRDPGVLFGALSGGCRLKYLPVDARPQPGDVVETAGFGGHFPKGFRIGTLRRVWKEPGQIYQVAEVEPEADLDRLEEVICLG